jgi:hypothetical protein
MLNVHELRKALWRRQSASQEYDGYLVVLDAGVRLVGRERATGIDAVLTVPWEAVTGVRIEDETLMLDVADGVPLLVRAFGGELALLTLERRIALAAQPPRDYSRVV